MTRLEKPRIYPLHVNGVLVDPMGRPYEPAPRYPGAGPIARHARYNLTLRGPHPEYHAATRKSQITWLIVRSAQAAKRDAMGYTPPPWLTPKKKPKRRQWLPGQHTKKPEPKQKKKSEKSQDQLF